MIVKHLLLLLNDKILLALKLARVVSRLTDTHLIILPLHLVSLWAILPQSVCWIAVVTLLGKTIRTEPV